MPTDTTTFSLWPWLLSANFSFLGSGMMDNLIKNAESKPLSPKAAMAKGGHFAVNASPFNGIKLELAIVLVVWLLLSAALSTFTNSSFGMFALIFFNSLLASLWVALRTRALMKKLKKTAEGD